MYELRKIYHASEDLAKEALRIMLDNADNYGTVRVSDYYDISSTTAHYGIDGLEYGWTNELLQKACITRDYKFGWYINLPNPIHLFNSKTPQNNSSDTEPHSLNIVLHTNEVSDPDAALAEIFKYIYTIKDRMVNLSIM